MTATTEPEVEEPPAPKGPVTRVILHPSTRIVLRWFFIGILALVAFVPSLGALYVTTVGGGLNGYVWTLPLFAILAAQGIARRPRTELPIHDRQTDLIVGTMGLVFALLLHAVLLQRYALYFNLLRLDLLAMWVFVLSSAIVLFGLRPVGRFLGVWLFMLTMFTLPYHLLVILLGGNRISAGAAMLIIAASATGISVGRTLRRGWAGGIATWAVGSLVLWLMAVTHPYAPVIAFQLIPAFTATALVSLAMFFAARRGQPKRVLDREVEPVAAGQVLAGLPLVLAVAILLAMVKLPVPPFPPPARFDALQISGPLNAPEGWHVTATGEYPWVKRLHGRIANLTRQQMVADKGNFLWDKQSRPRTVMVDNVITDRPFSFNVYPAKVLYDVGATRLSQPQPVDLGYGVAAQVVSVIDDHLLVTWNMMQFTWRNADRAQRVLLITVDDHDPAAPFPQPSGALLPTLNTLFTVLFRGNSAVNDDDPTFKDLDMLTTFGRDLVRAQLQPVEALER
jgi:hypothetical protein